LALGVVATGPAVAQAQVVQLGESDGTVHLTNAPTDPRYQRLGIAPPPSSPAVRVAVMPPALARPWVVPDDATALTADQRAAFLAGELYFNAHTTANPNGEIRGQLDKAGATRLASLNGAQETPAAASAAFGSGALAVDGATGEVSGFMVTSGLVAPRWRTSTGGARDPGGIIVPLAEAPTSGRAG
jgi:hypothetical protein